MQSVVVLSVEGLFQKISCLSSKALKISKEISNKLLNKILCLLRNRIIENLNDIFVQKY